MTSCIISFEKNSNDVYFSLTVKNNVVLRTLEPDVCAAGIYLIDPKCLKFRFGRGANKRLVDANHPLGLRDAFHLIDHIDGFECIKLIRLIQSSILIQQRPTIAIHHRFEDALWKVIAELPR